MNNENKRYVCNSIEVGLSVVETISDAVQCLLDQAMDREKFD